MKDGDGGFAGRDAVDETTCGGDLRRERFGGEDVVEVDFGVWNFLVVDA